MRWSRGVLLWFALFLLGCTTMIDATPQSITPVVRSTNTPTPIATVATSTFVPPTATASSPLPSATPTLVPLTQTGPWLVFGESNREAELLRPWVANSDGSGLRPLSSSASFDWEYQNEWVAVATKTSSFDTLNIWRLPGLEPIAEISLQRESYLDMESAGWSPGGCYFAFNVQDVEYYGKLKLYSCLDDTISDVDVVHRAFQRFISWSPDGKWLLYTVESDEDSVRTSPSFLFAYSPQENLQIEIPLEDLGFGYGIDWISNDEAVISPYPYEGDSWRVDYLSLRTNLPTMKVLYEGSFLGIVTNPLMREVLIGPYENCSLCDGSQDINLRIQIDSGEITAFEGDYYGGNNLPWRRDIGIVKDDHWAFISNKDQVISTYTPVQNSVAPQSSSDGAMILFPDAQNIHGSLLTTIEGETIRVLGNIKYATWLPNESIFLVLEPAGASQRLVRYGAATDWQAELLIPHLGKFYSIGVITPKS
jgi:hypothetical protein